MVSYKGKFPNEWQYYRDIAIANAWVRPENGIVKSQFTQWWRQNIEVLNSPDDIDGLFSQTKWRKFNLGYSQYYPSAEYYSLAQDLKSNSENLGWSKKKLNDFSGQFMKDFWIPLINDGASPSRIKKEYKLSLFNQGRTRTKVREKDAADYPTQELFLLAKELKKESVGYGWIHKYSVPVSWMSSFWRPQLKISSDPNDIRAAFRKHNFGNPKPKPKFVDYPTEEHKKLADELKADSVKKGWVVKRFPNTVTGHWMPKFWRPTLQKSTDLDFIRTEYFNHRYGQEREQKIDYFPTDQHKALAKRLKQESVDCGWTQPSPSKGNGNVVVVGNWSKVFWRPAFLENPDPKAIEKAFYLHQYSKPNPKLYQDPQWIAQQLLPIKEELAEAFQPWAGYDFSDDIEGATQRLFDDLQKVTNDKLLTQVLVNQYLANSRRDSFGKAS